METQLSRHLHVGSAGWSIPKTTAELFPRDGSHLRRYAAALSAVEINTSFYRPHRPQTYHRWAETVPQYFRFAVKVPKLITHELRLCDAAAPLESFLNQCTQLGEKLGPVLLQLPPSLQFDLQTARHFCQSLRDRFNGDVACEPRHPSWFDHRAAERLLADFDIARVAADPAVVPAAGSPGAGKRLAYFRLHGTPRVYYSHYNPAFLERLADALLSIYDTGADVWCIFDNTAEGAATTNALALRELLGASCRGLT